jgi:hypothetical protein
VDHHLRRRTGNMPPLPGIYPASIVRNGSKDDPVGV